LGCGEPGRVREDEGCRKGEGHTHFKIRLTRPNQKQLAAQPLNNTLKPRPSPHFGEA
jgi:hypothetical protein